MKRIIIVGLIFVNVALAGALLLGMATQPAKAQVAGGANDYVVITGHIGTDWDALYILDLGSRKLGVWEFTKQDRRLKMIAQPQDLVRDFAN